MLTLETLEMLLTISESKLLDELLIGLLESPQLVIFFNKFPNIKNALLRELPQWRNELHSQLNQVTAPEALTQEFFLFQQVKECSHSTFTQQLSHVLEQLHILDSPFHPEAQSLIKTSDFPAESIITTSQQALFLQRWRASLILHTTIFHHQLIASERERLLEELQRRLDLNCELDPILAENDQASGALWDLSKAHLAPDAQRLFLHYADILQQQTELQKLAESLGRSQAATTLAQRENTIETQYITLREPAVIPEEINGVHLSNDIMRLLPAELATLGISELEYEFYRRLIEKQLVSYRLQGDNWREHQRQRPVSYYHNELQPRGPFIICIDTSGSMGGFNEQCAKAFCLALLRIALADNRRCFIMLFNTDIVQYEITAMDGLEQAGRFLGQKFTGGTDLSACLEATINKLNESHWNDADAVVISDFIAQRLPDELIRKIKKIQLNQNQRFHAVALSDQGKPSIMRIFNHIWRFDTGLKSRLFRRWKH